ncbi:MAG: tetratricopeptide repeat protein [Firmicutes bacterium]|nr:tetratricopeptide repeat protein [Bacillota bacterium]
MDAGWELLQQRGMWAWQRGLLFMAEESWSQWRAEARRTGSRLQEARSLNALGCVEFALGRLEQAEAMWLSASRLIESDPGATPVDWVQVMTNRALVAFRRGRLADAKQYVFAAQRCCDQVHPELVARVQQSASSILVALGSWEEAEATARQALRLFEETGDRVRAAHLLSNLGSVEIERGNFETARQYLENARDVLQSAGRETDLGCTYTELGRLWFVAGDVNKAAACGSEALRLLWSNVLSVHKMEAARLSELFGAIALAVGDRHSALIDLQRASAYFAQASMWREWSRVNRQLDALLEQRSGPQEVFVSGAGIHPECNERLRYLATLLDLLDSIESLYPELRFRAELAAWYALLLGEAYGLDQEEREALAHAAKLQDVGLASLEPEIMDGSRPLSRAAQDRVRAHPTFGEQIVSLFPVPAACRDAIRHHHERYDGRGYPDGLAGEDIPHLARIIAVASTYVHDAVEWGHRHAMENLVRQRGRALDPVLVDHFIALHEGACNPRATGASGPSPLPGAGGLGAQGVRTFGRA